MIFVFLKYTSIAHVMILVYNRSPRFQAYFQIFHISQYIVGNRIVQSIFMQDATREHF